MSQIDPYEARLLALERRQVAIDDMLRRLKRDSIALVQGTWDDDARVRTTTAPVATCSAAFNGVIKGCSNIGLAGVTVTATEHMGTGAVLGTFTTDSFGGYSGTLSVVDGTMVDFGVAAGNRFDAGSVTATLSCSSTVTAPTLTLTPSTGYACLLNCAYPVATTLTVTDTLNGTFTLTYNAGTQLWTGCAVVSLPSYTHFNGSSVLVTCPAVSSALRWTLNAATGAIYESFKLAAPGGDGCAEANTCVATLTDATVGWTGNPSGFLIRTCWTPSGGVFGISAKNQFTNTSQFYRGAQPQVTYAE